MPPPAIELGPTATADLLAMLAYKGLEFDPSLRRFTTEILRDVFAAGGKGAVADYRLEAKPWTGSYVAAFAALENVEMWHGDQDKTVPFAHALDIQAKVPKATLHKSIHVGAQTLD